MEVKGKPQVLCVRCSCAGFRDRMNELPVLTARVESVFPPIMGYVVE